MTPLEILAAGRAKAAGAAPYMRSALYSLAPREAPGLGTIGVTVDAVLRWDPEYVGKRTAAEMGGALLHECLHLLLETHGRQAGRQAAPWNVAADVPINHIIRTMQDASSKGVVTLPPHGMSAKLLGLPAEADTWTAERVYDALPRVEVGSGGGDNGDKGSPGSKPSATGGWCGGAAGRPQPGEPEPGRDGAGRSRAQLDRVRREVASAVQQRQRTQGDMPAGLVRWADETLRPPIVDWRQALRMAIRSGLGSSNGAVDHDRSKPSRRQASIGWAPGSPILSRLHAPRPKVAVIVDTSGSMGEDDLGEALAEVHGVIDAAGGGVEFLACDAAVAGRVKHLLRMRDAFHALAGGGGSDCRPAFEELLVGRPAAARPHAIVTMTDGHLAVPDGPPRNCKVVWCLIGAGSKSPATWGTTVSVAPHADAENP